MNGIVLFVHARLAAGSVWQNPYASACAASLSASSATPISANGTLHESRNAIHIGTVLEPPLQYSSPKFSIWAVVPGSGRRCGLGHSLSGPQLLVSAPLAVTVLNVDPGR